MFFDLKQSFLLRRRIQQRLEIVQIRMTKEIQPPPPNVCVNQNYAYASESH